MVNLFSDQQGAGAQQFAVILDFGKARLGTADLRQQAGHSQRRAHRLALSFLKRAELCRKLVPAGQRLGFLAGHLVKAFRQTLGLSAMRTKKGIKAGFQFILAPGGLTKPGPRGATL